MRNPVIDPWVIAGKESFQSFKFGKALSPAHKDLAFALEVLLQHSPRLHQSRKAHGDRANPILSSSS
jgi:hypothetical protein